ncbi:MAG: SDR family NAD(P)-dependent oxidoreductase [Ilumatobacteraceae bacterium]
MTGALTFDGKVVVVTGAGNGVGRAHALEFARRGARVVVNDLGGSTDGRGGDDAAARKVVAEIAAAGSEATPNFDSVATPAGGDAIIQTALDTFGRIDVLVSNAGILRDKSVAKLEWEDLDAVLDVHLRGGFYVSRPAFRAMKGAGGGRIILTTSASGLYGNFGQANYAAAKLGLIGLTRVLALEGARAGILANAVAPVATTRLTRGADGDVDDPMAPSNVSPLVVALAHESCDISGEVFLAGGGVFARSWVALAEGWVPSADELTVEGVAANWDTIRSTAGAFEPVDAMSLGPWLQERIG